MSTSVRLRPPRHQLDRRSIAWWRTQIASVTVPIVLGASALGMLSAWWYILAAALLLGGVLIGVAMPLWWYRIHRWEVTDTAVYTRSGYFWQEWRVAPMSRIQTVDTVRGPLQQLFRLATVTVTTASAKGAVRIAGLDAELAGRLAEELTETTQATPGDAT
ncbi:MAG: PH domain-containing protein [Actinophytocola sp.]|nr:PH domain-containing protein [Actinophytocola sp.]